MIDELENLRKEYATELPERLNAIRSEIDAISHALTHRKQVDWYPLKALVHKLSGSSGTYGFKKVSRAAREMEMLIESQEIQRLSAKDTITTLTRWYDQLALHIVAEPNKKAA